MTAKQGGILSLLADMKKKITSFFVDAVKKVWR
jgi:hypothetical protein